jgi:hypothetical protein
MALKVEDDVSERPLSLKWAIAGALAVAVILWWYFSR